MQALLRAGSCLLRSGIVRAAALVALLIFMGNLSIIITFDPPEAIYRKAIRARKPKYPRWEQHGCDAAAYLFAFSDLREAFHVPFPFSAHHITPSLERHLKAHYEQCASHWNQRLP